MCLHQFLRVEVNHLWLDLNRVIPHMVRLLPGRPALPPDLSKLQLFCFAAAMFIISQRLRKRRQFILGVDQLELLALGLGHAVLLFGTEAGWRVGILQPIQLVHDMVISILLLQEPMLLNSL